MTGDHEKVLGNGPWKAIGVSFIIVFVLLILSVVVNICQFAKTNNCRKGHGQQAVPDSDVLIEAVPIGPVPIVMPLYS